MKKRVLSALAAALCCAAVCCVLCAGALADGWESGEGATRYRYSDGGYAAGGWTEIERQWYWFDAAGVMRTGWLRSGGHWYYLGENGAMVTGWLDDGGYRYYLDPSGAMATGWRQLEGAWYYFRASGAMATGWLRDGVWYYLGKNGAMVTGWLDAGGYRYYLDPSGAMVTGWRQLADEWYYFRASGAMATGWLRDGVWYYLGENGAMVTGWLDDGGYRYYLDESGAMVTGWRQLEGEWYYFRTSGAMATGWTQVAGLWYYLDDNGVMLHDTAVDGYYLGSDGAWRAPGTMSYDGRYYTYTLAVGEGEVATITGIDLRLASQHGYYSHESVAQAVEADAVCKYYADSIMADPSLRTDLDRVLTAAQIAAYYSASSTYTTDSAGHYRSPYGVFCAGVYTCAGSTRALGRMLDYMGFQWVHVNENQNHHQWCELYMDGQWGYADGMGGIANYGEWGAGYPGYYHF